MALSDLKTAGVKKESRGLSFSRRLCPACPGKS